MSVRHEIAFEREICEHLGANGWLYQDGAAADYNRELALYPPDLIAWVQQAQPDAALVIFYDILNSAGTGPRETFWFAKAGFDAAALVESRQQWKSAVGIYEKMAAIPGPHAEQAKQRVRKLRLEHFLWD